MNRTILTVLIMAFQLTFPSLSQASDIRKDECRAVDHLASLKRPAKVSVGIAKDHAKKTCEFFVSLPPPNGVSPAFDNWYSLKLPADLAKADNVTSILKAISIFSSESRAKDIGEIIDKNPQFILNCVASMLKKPRFDSKSGDGRIQCHVPDDGTFVEFNISANSNFTLTIVLPRTV